MMERVRQRQLPGRFGDLHQVLVHALLGAQLHGVVEPRQRDAPVLPGIALLHAFQDVPGDLDVLLYHIGQAADLHGLPHGEQHCLDDGFRFRPFHFRSFPPPGILQRGGLQDMAAGSAAVKHTLYHDSAHVIMMSSKIRSCVIVILLVFISSRTTRNVTMISILLDCFSRSLRKLKCPCSRA